MPFLISKFRTHLRPLIFEKMVALQFSSLVDYYVSTLKVETNLDVRSTERARESDNHKSPTTMEVVHGRDRDRDRDKRVLVALPIAVPGDEVNLVPIVAISVASKVIAGRRCPFRLY